MTLTFGRSPFGPKRGSYNVGALPDHIAYVEPWPRRMRAIFGNRTVLGSRNGMMLHRTGTAPTLLFPLGDLTADVLAEDEPAGSWTFRAGNRSAPRAIAHAPALAGPAGADIEGLVIIDYSAGLPVRDYLPFADVRTGLLELSDTSASSPTNST